MDSLVNQTLKNIEIIIVNDASPDHSEDIILEYAARDSRIIYIKHEENKRQGGARNTGMRAAKGKYITFVDSDDLVDLCLYHNIIKLFQDSDADVVSFAYSAFRGRRRILETYGLQKKSIVYTGIENFIECDWTACSKVYCRKDIIEQELFFVEGLYWEDLLFWLDYCLTIKAKIAFLPIKQGRYFYRKHGESTTGKGKSSYSQLPLIFEKMYLSIQKRNKLPESYEHFSKILCHQIPRAWVTLGVEGKKEFIKNFDQFLKRFSFNQEEQQVFPAFYVFSKLDTLESKLFFMNQYAEKIRLEIRLENDFWVQFGKLPVWKKLVTLYQYFTQRLFDRI